MPIIRNNVDIVTVGAGQYCENFLYKAATGQAEIKIFKYWSLLIFLKPWKLGQAGGTVAYFNYGFGFERAGQWCCMIGLDSELRL